MAGYLVAKAMTEHHSHALWISFHHKVGALLTVYLVVQLLLGLCRPKALSPSGSKEKSRSRSVWEIVHKKGGFLMMTLSLIQILVGATLAPDFGGSNELSWVVACAVCIASTLAFGLVATMATAAPSAVAPAPAPTPAPVMGQRAEAGTSLPSKPGLEGLPNP
jgi:hypothetical protein